MKLTFSQTSAKSSLTFKERSRWSITLPIWWTNPSKLLSASFTSYLGLSQGTTWKPSWSMMMKKMTNSWRPTLSQLIKSWQKGKSSMLLSALKAPFFGLFSLISSTAAASILILSLTKPCFTMKMSIWQKIVFSVWVSTKKVLTWLFFRTLIPLLTP